MHPAVEFTLLLLATYIISLVPRPSFLPKRKESLGTRLNIIMYMYIVHVWHILTLLLGPLDAACSLALDSIMVLLTSSWLVLRRLGLAS